MSSLSLFKHRTQWNSYGKNTEPLVSLCTQTLKQLLLFFFKNNAQTLSIDSTLHDTCKRNIRFIRSQWLKSQWNMSNDRLFSFIHRRTYEYKFHLDVFEWFSRWCAMLDEKSLSTKGRCVASNEWHRTRTSRSIVRQQTTRIDRFRFVHVYVLTWIEFELRIDKFLFFTRCIFIDIERFRTKECLDCIQLIANYLRRFVSRRIWTSRVDYRWFS
jgi:hypothetical protein